VVGQAGSLQPIENRPNSGDWQLPRRLPICPTGKQVIVDEEQE